MGKSKVHAAEEEPEDPTPLSEVVEAGVERMDGVPSPTNGIPFLLMRSLADAEVDFLDYYLRARQLQRSAAASGSTKQRAASKHTLKVGGEVKYPINDCSDVEDAWNLRGHAKGVSQDRVESYIKLAASDLGCTVPGAESVKRYGKTISAATESRIRGSIQALHELLGDSNANPTDIPEEGVEMDAKTNDKAADKTPPAGTKGADNVPEPKAAVGEGSLTRADMAQIYREEVAKYLREQAPRVGSHNAPSMGGTGSGGRVEVANLDNSTGDGPIGTAGAVADDSAPEQALVDGEGNMKTAVAKTAANVKLATSEEESPQIGEQIARSIAGSIGTALGEALKPIKEQLEKIAKEDSKSQQRPFKRGVNADLLARDEHGNLVLASSDEQSLKRAIDSLDPVARDQVTRQLAKNAHPLMAGK